MSNPVDHDAREKATSALDLSMALSAGAGSGKTSVLTRRVVALLSSGAYEPRDIAAVTFTDKAAGELGSRVRDALEASLSQAKTPEEHAQLARVLDRLPDLTLSTIHSFCQDLLRHESLEGEFAPDSELGNEARDEELLATAITEWKKGLPAELARLLRELSSWGTLRRGAQKLNAYRHYSDVAATQSFDEHVALDQLEGVIKEIESAETSCKRPGECKLVVNNGPLVELVRDVVKKRAIFELVISEQNPKVSLGQAKDWPNNSKERYANALLAIVDWRDTWREIVHGEIVRDLRARLIDAYNREKKRLSVVSFDDLLADAARLLRTKPAARRRLRERFKILLIDEVQDTDPLQAEVAALLTCAIEEGAPWDDGVPESGRIFCVGDPKQSIYRFRGADVKTFTRLQSLVLKNGHSASLEQNFRSVPGIVEWVNRVYDGFPDYTKQQAHRAPAELDPVVLFEEGVDGGDEVLAVIKHIAQLRNEGRRVVDREDGKLRHVKLSDFMILLPSWQHADATADRLRAAGIECVVDGGHEFFARDEVRLCVSLLRAIVEPADTEAVAFVLRGLFGCSHVELAQHKKDGGSLRYTIPTPPPGPVTAALAVLLAAHRRRGSAGLAGLMMDVLEETGALAVWKLLPDGLARLANVDKLLFMVRKAELDTNSPFAVVEEIQRLERNKDKDVDRIGADNDAVRITSLFKAKGLEAPIVFLMLCDRKRETPDVLVDHKQRTVAVSLGRKLRPHGWSALAESEKIEESAERRRWMYVAATRARDQLVICRGKKSELLEHDIDRGLPPRPAPPEDGAEAQSNVAHDSVLDGVRVLFSSQLPDVPVSQETFAGMDEDVDALIHTPPTDADKDGEHFAARTRDELRTAKRACVRWRAATSDTSALKWEPGTPIDDNAVPEAAGARAGRVVHAVMERLDLRKPTAALIEEGVALAEILSRQAGIEDAAPCKIIVERIVRNPLIEEARNAPERWHEVPFTYHVRGPSSVISGTIDLCFPIDAARKQWVIFDWKSKVPPVDSKLRKHYEEQLKKYAKALLSNLGDVEVVKTEIVGPHKELGVVASPEEILVDVRPELRAGLADLLELGAPEPRLDFDIGEGEHVISADVAWEEREIALVVDPPEEGVEGWTLVRTIDEAKAALGIHDPEEDA